MARRRISSDPRRRQPDGSDGHDTVIEGGVEYSYELDHGPKSREALENHPEVIVTLDMHNLTDQGGFAVWRLMRGKEVLDEQGIAVTPKGDMYMLVRTP